MIEHAVVIAGGGPTALMLAGVDVSFVGRRVSQALAGSCAGGLHSCTIEVHQRGMADRFLWAGQVARVAGFVATRLDVSDAQGVLR